MTDFTEMAKKYLKSAQLSTPAYRKAIRDLAYELEQTTNSFMTKLQSNQKKIAKVRDNRGKWFTIELSQDAWWAIDNSEMGEHFEALRDNSKVKKITYVGGRDAKTTYQIVVFDKFPGSTRETDRIVFQLRDDGQFKTVRRLTVSSSVTDLKESAMSTSLEEQIDDQKAIETLIIDSVNKAEKATNPKWKNIHLGGF